MEELSSYFYFITAGVIVSVTMWILRPGILLYQKLFALYLVLTLLVEIYANYLSSTGVGTLPLYNIFGIIEFTFYFYILHEFVASIRFKQIIKIISYVYPVICFLNMQFYQKNEFNSVTYALGALIVASSSMFYFLELFRNKHSIVLQREPAFWICSGLLFYYCCTFPYFALFNYIQPLSMLAYTTLESLKNLINCLLYSLFTIAFLCRLRIPKFT